MNILVVGGAGYIGSHMVKTLAATGHAVTTYDNLSKGYRDAVRYGEFVHGDLADRDRLDALLKHGSFGAVMHFASFIEVGESVIAPAKYYDNNVTNTLNLLDAMVEHGPGCFIFSSSAAIFGEPQYTPIDEIHPKNPINPYGKTKLMVEQILEDYDRAYSLKAVALRYFNAAGADVDGQLGERHEPESHLLPLILQAASGRREAISVFGDDYDTADGTCIRDFIHVQDLCDAHLLALNHLVKNTRSGRYNLGNGAGFSVREVIESARAVTGHGIEAIVEPRRSGDPAVLVADCSRARTDLGWDPRHSGLAQIIETAWNWEQSFFCR